MAKLYNLARMTTATTGTGTITLGSAVTGFLAFGAAGVGNGETVTYAIQDGSASEIGRGVYTASGTTLSRTVLKSTNGGNAINLSGQAQVFITVSAEDFNALPNTLGAFNVSLAAGTNVSANRTLTLTTGDANRTVTISADATISQDYSTTGNPQFATIELGAASDTTISRSSAGVIAVEGVTIPLNSTTSTHTAQQIELGHASDTTVARTSAGVINVEGSNVILASNKLSALSATTSAELAGVISDETGSGALVFGTGPTLSSTTAGTFSATAKNTANASSVAALKLEGDRSAPANGDQVYQSFHLSDSAGNQDEFARITVDASDVTSTSEDAVMYFSVITAGTLAAELGIRGDAAFPVLNDGMALGLPSNGFSDLHLATGGVINWANGEVTITETDANTLTVAGASAVSLGTSAALTTGTIELGAASDTTISRSAAGVIAVEGNLIPDYEAGTWTPTLSFATPGDVALSYTNQVGYYHRIGDWVFLGCRLTVTPTYTTASGAVEISGVPFNSHGTLTIQGGALSGHTAALTYPASRVFPVVRFSSTTKLGLVGFASGQASASIGTSQMASASQQDLFFSLHYRRA